MGFVMDPNNLKKKSCSDYIYLCKGVKKVNQDCELIVYHLLNYQMHYVILVTLYMFAHSNIKPFKWSYKN